MNANESKLDSTALKKSYEPRASGKKFYYFQVPMEMIRKQMGEDLVTMYGWFERVGYQIDTAGP